jgi:hypothetical protein
MLVQATGAPAFSAACSGGSPGSQWMARNRRPVTCPAPSETSQASGGAIASGWIKIRCVGNHRRVGDSALDAQNAAHAAFAGQRTVTPKSRDGMIEALRVLKACRKTAVAPRRVALQMIHNTIAR